MGTMIHWFLVISWYHDPWKNDGEPDWMVNSSDSSDSYEFIWMATCRQLLRDLQRQKPGLGRSVENRMDFGHLWTCEALGTQRGRNPKAATAITYLQVIQKLFKQVSGWNWKTNISVSGLAGRQKLARRQGLWVSEIQGVGPSGFGALMRVGQALYSVIFSQRLAIRTHKWRIHPKIPINGPFVGTNSFSFLISEG